MRAEEGPPAPEEVNHSRPKTRGECVDGPRPCPYLGCRYHLGLHVRFNGLTLNFEGEDPSQMQHTCALDVADRGPQSQQEVARLLGLSRARANDLEVAALRRLRECGVPLQRLHSELGEDPRPQHNALWKHRKISLRGEVREGQYQESDATRDEEER